MRWMALISMIVCVGCGGEASVSMPPSPDAEVVDDPDADAVVPDASNPVLDMGTPGPDVGVEEDTGPDYRPGLTAEYFAQYRDLVLTRNEPGIDHAWGDAAPAAEVPADFFSARWTGELLVPESGDYTFWVEIDDGMRMWVGDELVLDQWTWQFPTRYETTVTLAGGWVPIVVEYMERDLGAEAHVGWRSATISERLLGRDDLRTTGEPTGVAPRSPYLNPVVGFDCPDPGVIRDPVSLDFFAICTGGPFHIRRSPDLVFWEDTGADVLPGGKPAWAANGGRNWAPEIHKVGDKWVVYYTSVNGSNVLSIGAAYADAPTGPYTDVGAPLVQHPQGVIDAHYFRDDDGKHYLTYKIDGNSVGQPTPIYIRELAADGLGFAAGSTQTELIRNNTGTWEGGVVEAQWLIKRSGTYYLFYSGNVYDHRYRTGVARASSVTGPYEKLGPPILTNNSRWVGPGHGSVLEVGGEFVFVYHAWPAASNGTHQQSAGRHILVDRIRWQNGWPAISDGTPSRTPQPAF